jgi:hypothetical protein
MAPILSQINPVHIPLVSSSHYVHVFQVFPFLQFSQSKFSSHFPFLSHTHTTTVMNEFRYISELSQKAKCVSFSSSTSFHGTRQLFNTVLLNLYPVIRYYVEFLFLFYIYCSVHHNILLNNQQMQLYAVNFITLLSSLYMFRAAHTPNIRSTMFNCIYSHWYKP